MRLDVGESILGEATRIQLEAAALGLQIKIVPLDANT
jgi:hypothetical protein